MKKLPPFPEIPTEQPTPCVVVLLGMIEELRETVQRQQEEIGRLKDEIALLKGEKARPKIKPSGMEKEAEKELQSTPEAGADGEASAEATPKRAGSAKRSKTAELQIHQEIKCAPTEIPEGSRFRGYEPYVVQELVVEARNTRFLVECWQTPEGEYLRGELPAWVDGHYGPRLKAMTLYLHHHGRMTQPLLQEMLHECGIEISTGQIDALLGYGQDGFLREKQAVLQAGLETSESVTVDDTGARHQGRNGYTTHIGNDVFAWFETTDEKSRVNFLRLLQAGREELRLTEEAFLYMGQQRLSVAIRCALAEHPVWAFKDEAAWQTHLRALGIVTERHIRIATEGLLVGQLLQAEYWKQLAIISDDAGQFAVPLLIHGLCWVHAERTIHKLNPGGPRQQAEVDRVRGQIWAFYKDLKAYGLEPDEAKKGELEARFDAIFQQKTGYASLDLALQRLHRNREELLLVLKRPEVPLHTNGSERDIREQVIRKKISGTTRSDLGRQCRDTFLSLKKTCRKLGLSFWLYLLDRIQGDQAIPPLPELIRQRALTG
jgi:hypothetical protein